MGNSVSSIGNVGGQLFKQLGTAQQSGNVGGMFSQMGIQPIKPTGNYASSSGFQNMMQRLYGNPSLTGQYQTTKSAAQPSSVPFSGGAFGLTPVSQMQNPFQSYRSMNMMPYWMALTRRFMGY